MWIMKHDVLHTTNHGFDNMAKPLVNFDEFLLDICIIPQNQLNSLVKDMYEKEMSKLQSHMKSKAVSTIVEYRKKYAFYQEKHNNTKF